MYRIDNATAITPIPAPAAVGPNPNYFFTKGNPGSGIPATVVDDDWANAVQEEICGVIEGAGILLDKTKRNQLLTALQGKLARKRLAANTTFYVDVVNGNNANSGLAAGAGFAWQTIPFAISQIQTIYDLNGFGVTIQLADGTYPLLTNIAGGFVGATAAVPLVINGNAVTPANVVIGNTIAARFGSSIQVQNVKVVSSSDGLVASDGGELFLGVGIEFGACAAGAHLYAAAGGRIFPGQNYKISGGAQAHYQAINNGMISCAAVTVTVTGTPAFSAAFANILLQSLLGFAGVPTFTASGTGTRYLSNFNSVINTTTANASLFPGNAAGTASTGGQYA